MLGHSDARVVLSPLSLSEVRLFRAGCFGAYGTLHFQHKIHKAYKCGGRKLLTGELMEKVWVGCGWLIVSKAVDLRIPGTSLPDKD